VLNGAGYWIWSTAPNLDTGINVQADQVKITNLNIQGFDSPLNITGSNDVITQTYLASQGWEITVQGSNDSFVGNQIVDSSISTTGYDCFVENNFTRGGVDLYGAHNCVSENVFYSSGVSLWGQTSFNTITGNTFNTLEADNSSFGISLCGTGMESNTIYLNNFMSNVVPVVDDSNPPQVYVGDRFDNGSVGNYWSDYATKNTNGRGIATIGIYNAPYPIYGSIMDNYPLTSPVVEKITMQIPNPTPLSTTRPPTNNVSQI
jgi:nitrous oxidase accessory protein NosD